MFLPTQLLCMNIINGWRSSMDRQTPQMPYQTLISKLSQGDALELANLQHHVIMSAPVGPLVHVNMHVRRQA